MRMTGVSGSCSRTAARMSVPVPPGILMSVSTMSGADALSASRPALPPWAVTTSNPRPSGGCGARPGCRARRRPPEWMAAASCGFLFPPGGGEIHGERRSLPLGRIHQHEPAMRLHGALHNGEPQAGSPDTARHERVEQARPQVLGDARAIVTPGEV